jgi:beta-lactamase class A
MNSKLSTVSLILSLVVIAVLPGCSRSATNQHSEGTTQKAESTPSATTQTTPGDKAEDQELQKQIEQIATTSKGKVGVAAVMLQAEKAEGSKQKAESTTQFLVSLNPHDHFPMQSVYKLPIGMALMKQVDAGKIKLDQKVRVTKDDYVGTASHSPIRDKYPNGTELTVNELMGWMLKESDGTASDVLMRLAGGPEAVNAFLHGLNITDIVVLDTEKAFAENHSLQYRNWATPAAAVSLLRALYDGRALSAESRTLLLKLMTESNTGPKRLKGLLPAGTIVAHKTGTSATDNGVTAATNDIGIITLPNGEHLAIAVFVSDSKADEATREATIAKIARVVWEKSGGR